MRMRTLQLLLAAPLLVLTGLLSGPARAVDGVVEINQTAAATGGVTPGDAAGLPVTISVSGSYRLTSDLTAPDENTDAIQLTADDVTVDLNGFSILGPCTVSTCAGTGTGLGITGSSSERVTVRNGSIRGMGGGGLSLGGGCIVEGVKASANSGHGIQVNNSCILVGNTCDSNHGDGISTGSRSLVRGNVANQNGGVGLAVGQQSTVMENTAAVNGSVGLQVNGGIAGYGHNAFTFNNGGNGFSQVGVGAVEIAPNLCATNTTCP